MKTVLEWKSLKEHPRTPETLCLFSDGIRFRVGWWSRAEEQLYIPNSDGHRQPADSNFRPTAWARLHNLKWEMNIENLIGG